MKKIKETVLQIMKEIDTSNMTNNEFIWEYFKRETWDSIINENNFINSASTEWISRARRSIIKTHGIWIRKNADTEKEYQDEYCIRNNLI